MFTGEHARFSPKKSSSFWTGALYFGPRSVANTDAVKHESAAWVIKTSVVKIILAITSGLLWLRLPLYVSAHKLASASKMSAVILGM